MQKYRIVAGGQTFYVEASFYAVTESGLLCLFNEGHEEVGTFSGWTGITKYIEA